MGAGNHNGPQGTVRSDSLSEEDGQRPDTADGSHTRPEEQQKFAGHLQQQQKLAEPSRSHPQGRQAQETQGPQYKLQAKITGLERTGRKDPILRFDVHVRTVHHMLLFQS